jgi:uncharacterized membrane protein
MFYEIIHDLWKNSRWRVIGVVAGLLIGILFLLLGFFKTIFLMICVGLGFFIGNKLDKKEDLIDFLDRLLPPGYHK